MRQLLALALFFLVFSYSSNAAPVTPEQAEKAAKGWLNLRGQALRNGSSELKTSVTAINSSEDQLMFYQVDFENVGAVITSIDDDFEPVIVYSATPLPSALPKTHPLYLMLQRDKKNRKKSPNLRSASPDTRQTQALWAQLMTAADSAPNLRGIHTVSDVRVTPLVKTKWGQEDAAGQTVYNRFTPNSYPAGCVPTAMAQLMYYHRYPTQGIGINRCKYYIAYGGEFFLDSDYTMGGDGYGGPYQWYQMPQIPANGISSAGANAIGRLCYDAGLSLGNISDVPDHVATYYAPAETGAYVISVPFALQETFDYAQAEFAYNDNLNIPATERNRVIGSNLDAGYPVMLGIVDQGLEAGHAVLCDGYSYENGTLYHHLNMGWEGYCDLWYNLPTIQADDLNFSLIDAIIYNVFPKKNGRILSGRVLYDHGQPIANATITINNETITTNSAGVYGFVLPQSGYYTVQIANAQGSAFPDQRVYFSVDANQWGRDFIISTKPDLAPYTPMNWDAPIVINANAQSTREATTYVDEPRYLNVTIKNMGRSKSSNATAHIKLNDAHIHTLTIDPTSSEGFRTFRGINLPQLQNLSRGHYTLTLEIDPDQKLDEEKEDNNIFSHNFYVGPSTLHGEITSIGPNNFSGGTRQGVYLRYKSYRLGDQKDCYIECHSLPEGWQVEQTLVKHLNRSDMGYEHSAIFYLTPPISGGNGEIIWKMYDAGDGTHPATSTLLTTLVQKVSASNKKPAITTGLATDIEEHSVTLSANSIQTRGGRLMTHGIEISESADDWTNAQFAANESGQDPFSVTFTNLTRNTRYYYRAYLNVEGHVPANLTEGQFGYGQVKSFKTIFNLDETSLTDPFVLIAELNDAGINNDRPDLLTTYQQHVTQHYERGKNDPVFLQNLITCINNGQTYITLTLEPGWNLVSTPFTNTNLHQQFASKERQTTIFNFGASNYQRLDATDQGQPICMTPGLGYWVYAEEPAIYLLSGDQPNTPHFLTRDGWNMIGPFIDLTDQALKTQIPNMQGPCFQWDTTRQLYQPTQTLKVGQGYWIFQNSETP